MKTGITEIVYILDRSGSMSGLEKDTIGGFNSMIQRQKEIQGQVFITTVLLDDDYELLHNRIPLQEIIPLTDKEYYVRGSTALLDALGITITRMIQQKRVTPANERADKVLFIITTDGYENASREYTYKKIRSLIDFEKEKYGWEFLFMGANMDAVGEAAKFGISADRAAEFSSDAKGVELNYAVMSNLVTEYRTKNQIDEDWKAPIEEDQRKRGKRK